MKQPGRQDGFTLLEVVLALSILSVSLAVLTESFAAAAHRSEKAKNLADAAVLASSIRERLNVDIDLSKPGQTGRDAKCSWSVTTQADRPTNKQAVMMAYRVQIEARCGEEAAQRSVRLEVFEIGNIT